MSEERYLTVSALNKYLKRKFDADPHLSTVYIIGEVSNFRLRATHQYFSLKDDDAKIKVVCYQSTFKKIGFIPEEGMKVMAVGRVSLFPSSGEYQLYIDHMEIAGTGALFQAYKALQERLTKEGIFSKPKKIIPKFPKKIAIVTSESGAVIHDIQTTIKRRYPIVELHVYPTIVQGKDSAQSIINNLRRIESSNVQYDTVIIARGGGSIEDLWSFNEESVVRAVADFSIPIISSIGHETDTTLTDFAADLRAATPTAAAECAVPVLNDVLVHIQTLHHRLITQMNQQIHSQKNVLQKIQTSYIFQQPDRLYDSYVQKLEYKKDQLYQHVKQIVHQKSYQTQQLVWQFEKYHPGTKVEQHQLKLEQLIKQINEKISSVHDMQQNRLMLCAQKLDLLSPLKSMARGYSYVTRDDQVVSSVESVAVEDVLTIQMLDGSVQATVNAVDRIKKR